MTSPESSLGTSLTSLDPVGSTDTDERLATPHDSDVSNVDECLLSEDDVLHISHSNAPPSAFRARPAPATTFIEGVGPRLTKAAALRQGLEWDDPRDARRALGEEVQVAFDNIPGHKRSGLALNVAALAEPSVTPRQNRATMLRMGVAVDEPVRNMAENAARNKARDLAEREQRRKSVALPQSLATPEVTPRQNRAALLRLGQVPASQGRDPRDVAQQAILNKEREAAERLAKRKSVALPASLAAPTIVPRANRASMLRTGDPAATSRPSSSASRASSAASRPSTALRPSATPRPSTMFFSESSSRLTSATASSAAKSKPSRQSVGPLRSLAAPVITPRANRASKLRTGSPVQRSLSRNSSTSSLTSMSTGTSKLNPSPVRREFPMPSPKSRYTAPRPAPLPPSHKPATPSVSSDVSAAVETANTDPSPSPSGGSERRNSIFRRLNPRHSGSSTSSDRSARSSILGSKMGTSKTRA